MKTKPYLAVFLLAASSLRAVVAVPRLVPGQSFPIQFPEMPPTLYSVIQNASVAAATAALTVTGIEPPNTAAPAKRGVGWPISRRPQPKAEWMDPDRSAPNGTQYKLFASKVLGREVSYRVWLPTGYGQGEKRYPVIYWLHGMGGNQRAGATMFVPQVEAAIREGVLPPVIIVLVNGMVPA